MRRWAVPAAALVVLALLAPLSSRLPDAVQNVLHLPGGAGSFWKATAGIAVVMVIMSAILYALKGMTKTK